MKKLENTIVLLFGHTGIGKFSIATEMAAKNDFVVLDNHYFNNPIYNLFERNNKSLPQAVRKYTKKMRELVLQAIVELSPPRFNFIFTNVMYNEDAHDVACYKRYLKLAKARKAKFYPVKLTCAGSEISKRIVNPERRQRMKLMNAAVAQAGRKNFTLLDTNHPNAIELDITKLNAKQAARKILESVSHAA